MPKEICMSRQAAITLLSCCEEAAPLGCGDSQRRSASVGCCHGVCGRRCCGGASCGCCSCNPGHRCCGGSKGCCGVHSCGCSSGAGHCEVWRHLPDSHFPMSSLALPNLSPFRPLPDTRVLMSSLVLLSLFVALSLFPPALPAPRPPPPFDPLAATFHRQPRASRCRFARPSRGAALAPGARVRADRAPLLRRPGAQLLALSGRACPSSERSSSASFPPNARWPCASGT